MYISQDIQDKLYPEYQNIAGIYIRFNEATGEAQAMVLGWDWAKTYADCGISGADFSDFSSYRWWWSRLRADVLLIDHEPEEYVSTFKVVDLGNQGSVKSMMANWMAAGSNPLVELGLMPQP
jgi:formylmethanofuran dehydrogenase subunit E-like metal-binding protein